LEAQRGKYAVGAFNTSDLETTKAIIAAAEALKSPVIVQVSEKAISYAGLEEISEIVQQAAKKSFVPIGLSLDHGSNLEIVSKCAREGFTAVMFDGSKLTFSENAILTAQAVKIAHSYGATCEGELGNVSKTRDEKKFTNPLEVPQFVRETGVDFLAVAIGSSHGHEAEEELDIDLLRKIRRKTSIPMVLHGGSGVAEKDIKKAIINGICKINIDTDIRHTFTKAIHEISKKFSDLEDPRDIMKKVMAEIQIIVEEKIRVFGSDGKA
jgi:fructose-bisphosphate aldolase class II